MAAQDTTVPMDDKELMDAAFSPEPTREEPVAERVEEQPGQPRDEQGRFAPKAETTEQPTPVQAEAEQTVQPQPDREDKDGQIPSWRLRETREERDAAAKRAEEAERRAYAEQQQRLALQRQLEQLQRPKQDPVNFFENPDGAFDQRVAPIQEQIQSFESRLLMRASRAEAIAEHGLQAVKDAEAAVGKAMASGHPEMGLLGAQMRSSDHPVDVAVNWHKRSRLLEDTGGDLNAYRQKILDEAMKDPAFQAKVIEGARAQAGGQQSRPSVQLPPSLTRAPGTGVTTADIDAQDMSHEALYRHATSGR